MISRILCTHDSKHICMNLYVDSIIVSRKRQVCIWGREFPKTCTLRLMIQYITRVLILEKEKLSRPTSFTGFIEYAIYLWYANKMRLFHLPQGVLIFLLIYYNQETRIIVLQIPTQKNTVVPS